MYRAFTKSLARQMERSSVSFGTFEAVALQGVSVRAWASLVEDYFTNSGVRAKLTVSWMIFALSYVLIFPTLMSAMTGYSGTYWQSGNVYNPAALTFGRLQQRLSPIFKLRTAMRSNGHHFDRLTTLSTMAGALD